MDIGFISLKLSETFIKIHIMYDTIQSPGPEIENHSCYACYFIFKWSIWRDTIWSNDLLLIFMA